MRRRRDGHGDPRPDLEILDPVTGEPHAAVPDGRGVAPGVPGASRRRWLAALLALLSVACATGAVSRAAAVRSLQRIDRTWAQAMALDRARQAADEEVRAAVVRGGGATGRERDRAYREALSLIGAEATTGLLALEGDLAEQRILDDRVAAVRSSMVDALRFRRRQLSSERGLLGSTPLQRADGALREQRLRFALAPARVRPYDLRAADAALEAVQR